jgi:DNA-binding sugar fermentation-stimulating protein
MLFALNRPEGSCFAPAWAIDPSYGRRLREVADAGVEVLAVRLRHGAGRIDVGEGVAVDLSMP